jgi:class 3 adenylate cyclase/pimeloyl-ACP methyl ester carboxylesterase
VDTPETRYAEFHDIHIAYQQFGDGPLDIMYVPNWTWSVDLIWDFPTIRPLLNELAALGRTLQFDMPGTGSSDPLPGDRPTTLEEWMDTVGVVMDAANVERAALLAHDFGGMMAMLFAAAHPERVTALILFGSSARMKVASDYPIGFPEDLNKRGIEWWTRVWGSGQQIRLTAPSFGDDAELIRIQGKYERLAVPPGTARKVFTLVADLDVRSVLDLIRVPTLVMHRRGDRFFPVTHGRYLADRIAGARYIELPGPDHFPFAGGDGDLVIKEIRDFLGATKIEKPTDADRVLATVLFTDIVSSTERAATLGDRKWKELLDSHDRVVRSALNQFRGREIKTTGDGFLAAFDGPGKAINCANTIREEARRLGIEIRAGLHVGEVETRGEDIGGIAVHVASRVMSNAAPGEILVSSTVKDLVIGAGIEFEERGARELKGVPGTWNLYAVAA